MDAPAGGRVQHCEPLPGIVKSALSKRSNANAAAPGVADLRIGMTTAEVEATNACNGYGPGANQCYGNGDWTFSFVFDGDSLSKIFINLGSAGDGKRYEKVKAAVKARYAKVNHELSADDIKSFLASGEKERYSVFNNGAVVVGLMRSESNSATDVVVQYLSGGPAAKLLRQHAPRKLTLGDLGAAGYAVSQPAPAAASTGSVPVSPFLVAVRVIQKECGMFWSAKSNLSASECGF